MEADVTILSETPPRAASDGALDVWRAAHHLCVNHLVAASWSECGCGATLCDVGLTLWTAADEAEAKLPWKVVS